MLFPEIYSPLMCIYSSQPLFPSLIICCCGLVIQREREKEALTIQGYN